MVSRVGRPGRIVSRTVRARYGPPRTFVTFARAVRARFVGDPFLACSVRLNAESALAWFALPRVDSRDGGWPGAVSSNAWVAFPAACSFSWLHVAFFGFFIATWDFL
jgi:hypothetical protein